MIVAAIPGAVGVVSKLGKRLKSRGARDKEEMDKIKALLTSALRGDASALAELRRLSQQAATATRKQWAAAAVVTAESRGATPFPYANVQPPTESELERIARDTANQVAAGAAPAAESLSAAVTRGARSQVLAIVVGGVALFFVGVYLVRRKGR